MSELIKAIFALYAAAGGATLRGLSAGGMWLSQAPQQATGLYIIVTPVSGPVSYAMGTAAAKVYTQDCLIQFTVATLSETGATNVVNAVAALESLYDFCTFSMTGKTLLVARRTSERGPIRDDDTRGYMAYVEYRFVVGG